MMPIYLGQPLYPQGFPIQPKNLTYEGQTVEQKFLLYCDSKATPEDEDILKQYIIYYMKSPLFKLPKKLSKIDIQKISLDDLIWECIDIGIDPF